MPPIVMGKFIMGENDSTPLTTQFDTYVSQYETASTTILSHAAVEFRDATALDKSLTALNKTFQEADTMIARYGTGDGQVTSGAEMKAAALGQQITLQIEGIEKLFPLIEQNDITFIQSAKVATLDQPALKKLAAELKTADEAFTKNLTTMIPPTPSGDTPPLPTSGADFPDTFAGNLINVRAPNVGSGLG